jgi:hypothetical protein
MTTIFQRNFFTTKYNALCNEEKITKLTPSNLTHCISVYSAFNPREVSIFELDSAHTYKTVNGDHILGADIKALTFMMYRFPRSMYAAFTKASGPQYKNSSISSGAPIPLVGYKRFHNMPFSICYTKKTEPDIIFKYDMLLGQALSSTSIMDNTIIIKDNKGLITAKQANVKMLPTAVALEHRISSFGNRNGSYLTGFGASQIVGQDDYNSCNHALRHMMLQRWIYAPAYRSDDMICDIEDFDNMPEALEEKVLTIKKDMLSVEVVGTTPKVVFNVGDLLKI